MPRAKRTIARDSVFRSTSTPTVEAPRQAEEPLPTCQTNVWFTDEELDWLDNHCQQIRRSGWRGIKRSALVRALVQAIKDKPIDLAGVSDEAELVETLKRVL